MKADDSGRLAVNQMAVYTDGDINLTFRQEWEAPDHPDRVHLQQFNQQRPDSPSISWETYALMRQASYRQPDAQSAMLGKFVSADAPDNYIRKAGTDHSYFDIDGSWGILKDTYHLTDTDLFDLLNKPYLDDIARAGKTVYFSHDPTGDQGSLGEEYKYLKVRWHYRESTAEDGSFILIPPQ